MTTPPPAPSASPDPSGGPSSAAIEQPGSLPARPAVRSGRSRRWLAWSLLAGTGLLVVAAALMLGLWRSENALRWSLGQVGGLQAQGVRGSLASGHLEIDRLDWTLPGQAGRLQLQQLVLDGVQWGWQAGRPALQIAQLTARRVEFLSGPPTATPRQAPAGLDLPIALTLSSARIDTLQVDTLPPMQQLQTRLALGAEGGRAHVVESLVLEVAALRLRAHGRIGTTGLLPVTLDLAAESLGSRRWSGRVQAEGPLARLATRWQAEGEPLPGHAAPRLTASAEVTPFATWPLAGLQLSTQALDLAALSAQWPSTLLSGTAEVQTSGLDQPARARITLDNGQPGRWDSARLPLRRLVLTLVGEPRHTDRLKLESFEATLADDRADAGIVRGRGDWQGTDLSLALQLDALQPARLDARAAPLRLSGPLNLSLSALPLGAAPTVATATEPRLALQAQLSGQALDRSGLPVQLTLDAAGSASQWQLKSAEAVAGTARASASGQARREAAGWRLAGRAALQQFDPLPWWRGAADSPWRRGPHRLNGELTVDGLWRDATPPAGASAGAVPAALRRAQGTLEISLGNSQLAGVPLSAALSATGQSGSLRLRSELQAAGNRLEAEGELALADGRQRGTLQLQAPALPAAAPLLRLVAETWPAAAGWLPSAGTATARAEFDGQWPAWRSQGQASVRGWRSPRTTLDQLDADWTSGGSAEAPLALNLRARQLVLDKLPVDRLDGRLSGSLASHALQFDAHSPLKPPGWTENLLGPASSGSRLSLDLRGQWQRVATGSRWTLQNLAMRGGPRDAPADSRPWLALQELSGALDLDPGGQPQALQLSPGKLQLLSATVQWSVARWRQGGRPEDAELELDATLDTIHVASWLQRLQPNMGWSGNLDIGGRLSLRAGSRMLADIVLERQRGDLAITDELGNRQALGLSELRLGLNVRDGVWQFAQGLAGQQIGEIVGAQVIRTTPERRWPAPDAPMQGVVQARVANLGVWGTWVPPGWRLAGSLQTSATLAGRFQAPELSGELRGSGLGLRNLLEGVNLSDGELAITLSGERAQVERFNFRGGDGRLTLTGGATLGAEPAVALKLVAERFRLLGRIDRRISASGSADLTLQRSRLQVNGDFTVDEGLIDVSRGDAPSLDSDVHIRRSAGGSSVTPAAQAAVGTPSAPGSAPGAAPGTAMTGAAPAAPGTPQAAATAAPAASSAGAAGAAPAARPVEVALGLRIGLGEQLRLRGRGIDAGLRGELRITSPANRLAIHGNITTQGGTYAAYGQKLQIDRGDISFSGSPDNARLDVLAVRPNLDVRVGVSVVGSLQNPRVRLISEPEMADVDKLSWLVLGRGPEGLGRTDTALLQRAAIALLAGNQDKGPTDQLIQSLGLTDFSVRQTDGEVRETIVSLGRQLSQRWYVGYERSVNATTGTWQLIYRAARRFTLRAQSGAENSLDLIWSWRW